MARADRALQRVVRPLAAKSVLHAFLKGSLVITFLLGIIGAFGPVPLKNAGNGFLTGLKSAVLIDSSHDGLEDVTEIGIPCSAALGLLAASEEKKAVYAGLSGKVGETVRAHQAGPEACQIAFARVGEPSEKLGGNAEFHNGVAKEFLPFIMCRVESLLIGVRGMCQGSFEELHIPEMVPQFRLQLIQLLFIYGRIAAHNLYAPPCRHF